MTATPASSTLAAPHSRAADSPPLTIRWWERRRDAVVAAGTGVAAVIGSLLLLVRDPHGSHSWAECPFHALTGWDCPGCGSLRGIHDLLVGRFAEAVGHDLLLVPALIWLTWWWLARSARALGRAWREPPSSARFCYLLLAGVALFTVLRNLPGSPLAA